MVEGALEEDNRFGHTVIMRKTFWAEETERIKAWKTQVFWKKHLAVCKVREACNKK